MPKTAEEVLREIIDDFNERYDSDEQIKSITRLLDSGIGSYREAHAYSKTVGELLADVFRDNISSQTLPDGRMYYNFAETVVGERLRNNYRLVVNVCKKAQKNENLAAKIKLEPIEPPINESRIKGILNRLDREPDFDKVKWILDAPVTNYTQSVVDDSIHANAEFHLNAGMTPKIRRIAIGKSCSWCNSLEGVWEYSQVRNTGNPVFQRHQRCDCLILYDPADGKNKYTDATSKREYNSKEEVREEVKKRLDERFRKTYNKSPANVMREEFNDSVHRGMFSPLVGFDNYYTHYTALWNMAVGEKTANGITVTGVQPHFMERVFGVLRDPTHNDERREGVSLKQIEDALFKGVANPIKPAYGKDGKPRLNPDGTIMMSQSLIGQKAMVTINPDTGELIQCNLISK